MRHIRKYDDPILSTVCEPATAEDNLPQLVHEMTSVLMFERTGVGLAAPQVGIAKRIILIRPVRNGATTAMVNPEIYDRGESTETKPEGCLSYPGVTANIRRHTFIRVRWFDTQWKQHERYFRDWEARIIQHELDHLDGICQVGDEWRRQTQPATV
jgi:peptide deformylase